MTLHYATIAAVCRRRRCCVDAAPPSPLPTPRRRRQGPRPCKKLLKEGADVNGAQGDGMTALHWAAHNGDAELAPMLLYAGANVGAKTRLGGYTPLHLAAQIGNAGGDRAAGRRRRQGRTRRPRPARRR